MANKSRLAQAYKVEDGFWKKKMGIHLKNSPKMHWKRTIVPLNQSFLSEVYTGIYFAAPRCEYKIDANFPFLSINLQQYLNKVLFTCVSTVR